MATEEYVEELFRCIVACVDDQALQPRLPRRKGDPPHVLPLRPTIGAFIRGRFKAKVNPGEALQVQFLTTWCFWMLNKVFRQYDVFSTEEMRAEVDRLLGPYYCHRPQDLMHLTGPGGSGKSFCMLCLVEFCRLWGFADKIAIGCPTNLAAALLGGQTVDALFQIKRNERELGEPAETSKAEWSRVILILLDEVSMIGAELLGKMNDRAKKFAGNQDMPFGNMGVILGGDMSQLTPVGGSRLDDYSAGLDFSAHHKDGLVVWKTKLTGCHILTTNVRSLDPEWSADLDVLRFGADEAFIAKLNDELTVPHHEVQPGSVYLVHANLVRQAIVRRLFQSECKTQFNPENSSDWRHTGRLEVRADVGKVKPSVRKYIFGPSVQEKDLNDYTPHLGLILGQEYIMPVKGTPPELGLPKGMTVDLIDIVLKDEALVKWDEQLKVHFVKAQMVDHVVVKACLGNAATTQLLEGHPVGVSRLSTHSTSVNLEFGAKKEKSFRMVQLPLRSSMSCTVHKAQDQPCYVLPCCLKKLVHALGGIVPCLGVLNGPT